MVDTEDISKDEELILKALEGDLTPSELEHFQERQADSAFMDLYLSMKAIWESSEALAAAESLDTAKAANKFLEHIEHQAKQKKRYLSLAIAGIAALLVSGIFLIHLLTDNKQTEILTLNDTKEVLLPDSSRVTINKNSRILYPKHFKTASREVYLSGEAYFKVKGDKNRPFLVITDKTVVKVVGTAFNVKTTKEETQVLVSSGTVYFYDKKKPDHQISLSKGESGSFSSDGQTLKKSLTQSSNCDAWATGKLVFEQTSLSEVVRDLSQYYQTSITLENNALGKCKLTAVFDHQSLDAVLNMLELTFDIKAVKKDGIILVGKGCHGE